MKIYSKVLAECSDSDLEEFKEIKLIPSVEIPCAFNFTNLEGQNYNIEAHILGYGVDLSKEELLEKFAKEKYKSINQEEELQRLIKIGHELGLNFSDEDVYLDVNDDNRKFAGRAFVQGLMKNMDDNFCKEGENNKSKLPFELRTNWRAFQNRCVKDLNSPFFLDIAKLNPDAKEVIELINDMGGRAYLAHPSAYFAKNGSKEDISKAFENTIKFTKDFISAYYSIPDKKHRIYGVEVYHPSMLGNVEKTHELKEIVKSYRLASSGGTDIHVDKTIGKDETVSNDSLGGKVKSSKIKKFRYLRRKSENIIELRDRINRAKEEEIIY